MNNPLQAIARKLYTHSNRDVYAVLPLSALGVVLGHILLYRWLFPEASSHHHELTQTGHGYFSSVVAVSVCLMMLGLVAVVRRNKDSYSADRQLSKPKGFWHNFIVLFVVQVVLFAGMELTERLLSLGVHGAIELISSTFFIYGFLFQLITAACMALLVESAEVLSKILFQSATVLSRELRLTFRYTRQYRQNQISKFLIRAPPSFMKY